MSIMRRLAKNSFILFISNIVSKLLGFLYFMYTARYLGVEKLGIISFALAFTGIFGVLGDLGLTSLTVREVARNKSLSGKYLGNIALIKVVLAAVTFALIAIAVNILGYSRETILVVYLIALFTILSTFSNMFYAIFQAYEKMEYQGMGQILSSLLIFMGVFWSIYHGYDVIRFAWVYLFAGLIDLLYSSLVCFWKFGLLIPEADLVFWKITIMGALPFFFSTIVDIIAFKIDMVMLSLMKGDAAVGWYSAAYRLIEALLFIPAIISSAAYPVLSNLYVTEKESLKLLYQKLFRYLVIIGIPIAFGTTILAPKIILFIYKSEFFNSIIALRVLIWTIPVIFLNYFFGTILASINQQVLALKINFMGMLLNIGLNTVLIPRYSYIGASIATIITCLMVFILFFLFLSKNICKISVPKYIYQPIIASIIMCAFVFNLGDTNIFLVLVLAIMVYFIVILILKTSFKKLLVNWYFN